MTLGSKIRKARTGAGFSIEDLAAATNLRAVLLLEIEENDFSHCGGDTYARGHVRIIARTLKVDEEEFLRIYDEEQVSVKRSIQDLLVENNIMRKSAEKRKVSWKTLLLISVLSLGVAAVAQVIISNTSTVEVLDPIFSTSPSPTPSVIPTTSASAEATPSATTSASAEATTAATTSATPTQSPAPTQSPTPTQSATVSATPTPLVQKTFSTGTGVEVVIRAARAKSWLFVSDASGRTLFSGELSKGSTRTFTSDVRLDLRVGNAGGVDLAVNGKPVASIGADGAVVNVSYRANS